jgi:hypothetical protein
MYVLNTFQTGKSEVNDNMSKCLRFKHKHRKHACHEDYDGAREADGPARPNILRHARGRVGAVRGRAVAARGRGRAAGRARFNHLAISVATSGSGTGLGDRQETSGGTVKGKIRRRKFADFLLHVIIPHIFYAGCSEIEER